MIVYVGKRDKIREKDMVAKTDTLWRQRIRIGMIKGRFFVGLFEGERAASHGYGFWWGEEIDAVVVMECLLRGMKNKGQVETMI